MSLALQFSTIRILKTRRIYSTGWNTNNQTLAYLLKTTLPEGVSLYSDHTDTVDSTTITANFQNAPLACVRTSDGKVST